MKKLSLEMLRLTSGQVLQRIEMKKNWGVWRRMWIRCQQLL